MIWQVEIKEPSHTHIGIWLDPSHSHEGIWLDIWTEWSSILEAAYQTTRQRPSMCHIVELEDNNRGFTVYEIDLRTYTQTSWNGTERRVRRVLVPSE